MINERSNGFDRLGYLLQRCTLSFVIPVNRQTTVAITCKTVPKVSTMYSSDSRHFNGYSEKDVV